MIGNEGDGPDRLVALGRISGLHGVRGWVKVYSDTRPRQNILQYSPWYLQLEGRWQARDVLAGRSQGKTLVARLEGCGDRETARQLMGATIAVRRSQLETSDGDYYWTDLEGLRVVTETGVNLGVVDHLMETGSNDVLVVKGERERLIPWLPEQVIRSVDLEQRLLVVDWEPEF
ncbi:MAG TPA: ribosome maturation factor RimM [Chromatiaceae bacterium]|nr:ribosome maturation factor RimM [Chromatiaceae bacterium]